MPRKAKDEEVKKDNKKKVSKVLPTSKEKAPQTLTAITKSKESNPKSSKNNVEVEKKSTSIKKASDKKSEVIKVATQNVPSEKKTASKSTTSSKTSKASIKASTKKSSDKKTLETKATKKTSTKTTAKSTTKTTTKKPTKKRTSTKKAVALTEYYDLPSAYNRTIVKILAQTPSSLFVYWEISEDDKIKLKKEYGEEFFSNTKPYLIITNETMSYSFEVEINDYANSWYLHINDSDCKYSLQLIRKSINISLSLPSSFVNITSSNKISAPNDHILFDKLGKTIFFRNVKSNIITKKDISSFSFISNIGRIYNIYDIYKQIYQNELNGNELGIQLSSS